MRIAEFDFYFCLLRINAISIKCKEKMRCIFLEKKCLLSAFACNASPGQTDVDCVCTAC